MKLETQKTSTYITQHVYSYYSALTGWVRQYPPLIHNHHERSNQTYTTSYKNQNRMPRRRAKWSVHKRQYPCCCISRRQQNHDGRFEPLTAAPWLGIIVIVFDDVIVRIGCTIVRLYTCFEGGCGQVGLGIVLVCVGLFVFLG